MINMYLFHVLFSHYTFPLCWVLCLTLRVQVDITQERQKELMHIYVCLGAHALESIALEFIDNTAIRERGKSQA